MAQEKNYNYSEYRNKSVQDMFLVVIFVFLAYLFSYSLGVYEWLYLWLDYFEYRWLNELLITLILTAIPSFFFGLRRYKELKFEINHREIVEETYKNYRNQIHKVFEALDDAVFQTDINFRIIWANDIALKINSNAIGAHISSLLKTDDDLHFIESMFQQSIDSGSVIKKIKYYPSPDSKQSDKYLEHTAIPFKDLSGTLIGVTSVSRDITERMQVEESKSRLASFIESSDDAIFVVALDGTIHSWNKAAETIFGYSASQVVGQQITILDHLINFETLIKIPPVSSTNLSGEKIRHVDNVVVNRKDGKIYVSMTVYPFVDETGKVLGFSTIARDITSAINSEEALRESESRFRQLSDSIEDAFWLIDWEKKKYLFISPAYKKIWGRQPRSERFDLEEWASDIHPDDRNRLIKATNEIVENNGIEEEFRLVDSDGAIRWVRDRGFPVYNSKGQVYRVAGIAQDITAGKLAEQALKESETRFKELFQNMSNGVAVYEAISNGDDFIVKDFNKAAENIESTNKSKIIGRKLKSILTDVKNHSIIYELKNVYLTGNPKSFLYTIYEGEKIVGWRQNYIYKLPQGDLVSIFDDVTQQILQERALKDSEERYRTFVTNFKGIAFRWTEDYDPIFMHGSVEEITGYSPEDFMAKTINWDEIIHNEDLQIVIDKRLLIKMQANRYDEFEYRIIRQDGSIKWLNETLHNICNIDNKIIYIQATIYDITQRKIAESELKASRQQLRNLALHLDSVREEERKQIAFEIHDELGYALTALNYDLAWLVKKVDLTKDNLDVRTKEMSDLIEFTIQKVRTISSQLRPSILDHFGIVAAIDEQSKEFQRRTAVRTRVVCEPKDISLPERLATPVFRLFQESLTNISRYAKASRVDVSLRVFDSLLILRVADNGIGISEDKIFDKNSFGLLGMREKAKSMGGEVVIRNLSSDPNSEGGTEVLLTVDLNNNNKAQEND